MKREQATKLAEQSLQELFEALQQGRSDALIRYLDMLAKLHRYSFGNCMLIAAQKPDATFVAGFRRWLELGRHVRKGERGIAILAPLVGKKKNDDGEEKKALYGFRVVHVFDVSQTDGKELPEFASIQGETADKVTQLEAVLRKHNIAFEYSPIPGGAQGYSAEGRVVIDDSLPPADRFAVLAHELAHELLHTGQRRKETSKTVKETEAEAVAYVVCRAAGLDCSTRSSDYILLHQGSTETLQQSLDLIQKAATQILTDLESLGRKDVQHAA